MTRNSNDTQLFATLCLALISKCYHGNTLNEDGERGSASVGSFYTLTLVSDGILTFPSSCKQTFLGFLLLNSYKCQLTKLQQLNRIRNELSTEDNKVQWMATQSKMSFKLNPNMFVQQHDFMRTYIFISIAGVFHVSLFSSRRGGQVDSSSESAQSSSSSSSRRWGLTSQSKLKSAS